MTKREAVVRAATARVHVSGVKPTTRSVLAELKGGDPRDYPQGMGGRDVVFFRAALRELGYWQASTGRWQAPLERADAES